MPWSTVCVTEPISESSSEAAARRLVLVHAHPDDETTGTGATMARYASEGVPVCLVTCTRGERGEVVADDLAQLRDAGPDALGKYRESELAAAMNELGVKRYVWLGGAGRWWDSGMVGTPENEHQRAFYRAELTEPVRALVEVLRREQPTVVVTYDPHGGYGHPDHIQAHRVTMAAITPAADPEYAPELGEPWRVPKVYWSVVPRSAVLKMAEEVGAEFAEQMPGATDDKITARLDGEEYLPAKLAALRAYRSQVNLDDGFFARFVKGAQFRYEHFQLVHGARGPAGPGEQGWEDDLFAGLA